MGKNTADIEKKIKFLQRYIHKNNKYSWFVAFFLAFVLYFGGSFLRDANSGTYYEGNGGYIFVWVLWILCFLTPIIFKLQFSYDASVARKKIESLKTDLLLIQNKNTTNKIEKTESEASSLKMKLIEIKKLKDEGLLTEEEYSLKRKQIIENH